jgi:hypothetical protein
LLIDLPPAPPRLADDADDDEAFIDADFPDDPPRVPAAAAPRRADPRAGADLLLAMLPP